MRARQASQLSVPTQTAATLLALIRLRRPRVRHRHTRPGMWFLVLATRNATDSICLCRIRAVRHPPNARVCLCARTRQSTDHESLQCRISGADAGVPIYSKDAEHQIYRYYGTWHVAHKGVVVFYDPPASSYWAPEPPLTGWRQFPNRTAWPPAPTLSAIRE